MLLLHDPDADGIHIGALLLMFFDRWMPALLDAGCIERVHAPMGEVHGAPGTLPAVAFGDAHLRALCDRARTLQGSACVARRYRGLGGISPAVLRATCVDPSTRMTSVPVRMPLPKAPDHSSLYQSQKHLGNRFFDVAR